MPQVPRLAIILICAIFAHWLAARGVASDDFSFFHENVLGTSLELSVLADSEKAARQAEDRILTEIDRLAQVFSGYDRSSEFSRWLIAPAGPRANLGGVVRRSLGKRPLEKS